MTWWWEETWAGNEEPEFSDPAVTLTLPLTKQPGVSS